jgi:hypothetical protein
VRLHLPLHRRGQATHVVQVLLRSWHSVSCWDVVPLALTRTAFVLVTSARAGGGTTVPAVLPPYAQLSRSRAHCGLRGPNEASELATLVARPRSVGVRVWCGQCRSDGRRLIEKYISVDRAEAYSPPLP